MNFLRYLVKSGFVFKVKVICNSLIIKNMMIDIASALSDSSLEKKT